MANLSDFLKSSTARGALGEPGSNGFWRREVYAFPGTYTWRAERSGKVKIQAIGAASGGSFTLCGNPGHYGEATISVTAGQQLTIVVGAGSVGVGNGSASAAAGTTSISGGPLATPLTLPGAPGVNGGADQYGVANAPTGPWDRSYSGGIGSLHSKGKGGSASASPFGPGVHPDADSGAGGCGWGGRSRAGNGASSFSQGTDNLYGSATGRRTRGGTYSSYQGDAERFWDLADVDSPGGAVVLSGSSAYGSGSGPGAGAGGGSNDNGSNYSALGGGTAWRGASVPKAKSGNGAGGIGSGTTSNNIAGIGGDGFVMIFFDEVQ